jgi:transposase
MPSYFRTSKKSAFHFLLFLRREIYIRLLFLNVLAFIKILLRKDKGPNEDSPMYLLMDRAYEDGETRLFAFEWGYSPVVPSKKNRKHLWGYDKELYKQRNEADRMFRRLKGLRRNGIIRLRAAGGDWPGPPLILPG